MAARARKPEPKIVTQVCSMCGLDWDRHGADPTTETCIELLIAETVSLRGQLASRPVVQPLPYIAPYPWPSRPYIVPAQPYIGPYWGGSYTVGGSNQASSTGYVQTFNRTTPALSNCSPQPIAA